MSQADRLREARRWQSLIAVVFIGLGGWCLLAPASIVELTVRPEHRNALPLTLVTIGAFGAQAMLVGLVTATATFTARTFLALGLALLPFFLFDWWFYSIRPLFNGLILLDVAGNLAMLAACARGYWLLSDKDDAKKL